jgi:hypothetical protein
MRSRVAVVFGFFVALVFASVSAQTTQDPRARKLYEFGASSSEYQKALMDFLAIEIQRNIVAYNGHNASSGAWRRVADSQVDRLRQLKVDVSRVKVIFGGTQKDTRISLWILPESDPAPVVGSKELPLRKAVKSGEFYIDSLQYEDNRERLFSNISSALREYPTVRAYVVVHLERKNEPASLTQMVRTWSSELKSKYNIGADRFIVRFARPGEVIAIYLELWMVPNGRPRRAAPTVNFK